MESLRKEARPLAAFDLVASLRFHSIRTTNCERFLNAAFSEAKDLRTQLSDKEVKDFLCTR